MDIGLIERRISDAPITEVRYIMQSYVNEIVNCDIVRNVFLNRVNEIKNISVGDATLQHMCDNLLEDIEMIDEDNIRVKPAYNGVHNPIEIDTPFSPIESFNECNKTYYTYSTKGIQLKITEGSEEIFDTIKILIRAAISHHMNMTSKSKTSKIFGMSLRTVFNYVQEYKKYQEVNKVDICRKN